MIQAANDRPANTASASGPLITGMINTNGTMASAPSAKPKKILPGTRTSISPNTNAAETHTHHSDSIAATIPVPSTI